MIDKVCIKALKSIKDLTVQCSNLNLLVGTNSSGKSTFLQALLLMAQNGVEDVGLNGKLAAIGDFREVRNYYMPNQSIKIEVWRNGKKKPAWIEFKEDKENESYKILTSDDECTKMEIPDIMNPLNYDSEKSNLLEEQYDFHYLSCNRIGANEFSYHPPHFHVTHNEFSAVFRLYDGTLYREGKNKWSPYMLKEVSVWYILHREELIEAWENLHHKSHL